MTKPSRVNRDGFFLISTSLPLALHLIPYTISGYGFIMEYENIKQGNEKESRNNGQLFLFPVIDNHHLQD